MVFVGDTLATFCQLMPSIYTFGQLMLVRWRSGYDLLNERMPITAALMVNLWLQLWTTYGCSDIIVTGTITFP
jgi:hypothetical protein